jgi:hypothetical protein
MNLWREQIDWTNEDFMYYCGYLGNNNSDNKSSGYSREDKGKTPLYKVIGTEEWKIAVDWVGIINRLAKSFTNIMQHAGAASLLSTISMADGDQRQGILISTTGDVYMVSPGENRRRIEEKAEDEAFYRDFQVLDNYDAAEQEDSHVFVVPGQTRDNNYPMFSEFSREIKWPVGCPLPQELATRVAGLHPSVYQMPPVTPMYHLPMLSNNFFWFGLGPLNEEAQPPAPTPTPRRRSIPQITLQAVQEEIEEEDVDPPPIQISHIRRTSSAQAIRSNWLGEPIVEYRATQSEGHGSDLD